jgi:hypothetical protein
VFEFPGAQPYTTERKGPLIVLRFPGAGEIAPSEGSARNIRGVRGGQDSATIAIDPRASIRIMRMDNRIVVDVLDPIAVKPPKAPLGKPDAGLPAAGQAPANLSKPAAEPQGGEDAATTTPPPRAPVPAASVTTPSQVSAPVPSPAQTPPPASLAIAVTTKAEPASSTPTVTLPFAASTGAAGFRHGDEAWFVFDERRPLDLGEVDSASPLSGASVELLPAGTLLRLKPKTDGEMRLVRRSEGWRIVTAATPSPDSPTVPTVRDKQLFFPVKAPGQVVIVPDPATGNNLLVGTLRDAGGGFPVRSQSPELAILPSWQGVVIEPLSDRVSMRAVKDGFTVDPLLALAASADTRAALAASAALTRRFDIPDDSVPNLLRRLQAQTQEQAQAPPQSRLVPRKQAAATMLALGLGPEAQAVLRLATTDDPRAADDPEVNGLAAIAALISGRLTEADGIDAPGLGASDEVTLWRAVRSAMQDENSAAAAQSFAATAGLILGYPAALRNRLLPLAAETMINGGAVKAADGLLSMLSNEPALAFARALRAEQGQDTATALTLFDALAGSRDRLTSARAQVRAALLRLRTGVFTPNQTADALERCFDAWRGDLRERDLRLRAVSLRAEAGEWRKAFELLGETSGLFPDDPAVAKSRMALLTSFQAQPPAKIDPVDYVSLVESNAGSLSGDEAAGLMAAVADKLVSLDLPHRADPVIEQMMHTLSPGPDRAALGARLASLRLEEDDGAGAVKALADSAGTDLAAELALRRAMLLARSRAKLHDADGALAALDGLTTPEAAELRAALSGAKGDWQAAATALLPLAANLPAAGPLTTEQQDLLLRLASAYAKAGDSGALQTLAENSGNRISGSRHDMFQLLTAAPVKAGPDLSRARRELDLARSVPTALASIGQR